MAHNSSSSLAYLFLNLLSEPVASIEVLNEQSAALVRDDALRRDIGRQDIWPQLVSAWTSLANAQNGCEAGDESLLAPVLSLARFTRNAVAGVPENQASAFVCEPSIRRLLFHYTSISYVENEKSYAATRMLVQAIANIITTNDPLATELWNAYMALPEEQLILIRLLQHPDERSVISALVLVLNCLHSSSSRAQALLQFHGGKRLSMCLLEQLSNHAESPEGTDGAQIFDIGYEIFCQLATADCIPALYQACSITDEPISPHQTTVLKLLDSFLQSQASTIGISALEKAEDMLFSAMLVFASYARRSIAQSLGSSNSDPAASSEPLAQVDMALSAVGGALVLIAQSLTTIILQTEDGRWPDLRPHTEAVLNECVAPEGGTALIESMIDLLRLVDVFVPKIQFGRTAYRVNGERRSGNIPGIEGFSYLKRDLVRLLGILAHGRKYVQDRMRECDGIPVVMSMCVVDENNPYLREHAILALRNLLEGNSENQAVVDQIRPNES